MKVLSIIGRKGGGRFESVQGFIGVLDGLAGSFGFRSFNFDKCKFIEVEEVGGCFFDALLKTGHLCSLREMLGESKIVVQLR